MAALGEVYPVGPYPFNQSDEGRKSPQRQLGDGSDPAYQESILKIHSRAARGGTARHLAVAWSDLNIEYSSGALRATNIRQNVCR